MKYLLYSIVFLCMTPSSCNTEKKDIAMLNSFTSEYLSDPNYDLDDLNEWAVLKPSDDSVEEHVNEFLTYMIDMIQKKMSACEGYLIIPHLNIEIKPYVKEYRLEHEDYNEVYYLICDEQIITPFIVRDGELKAFFVNFTHGVGDKKYAVPLNTDEIVE